MTRNRKLAVGGAVTMIIGGLVGVVVLATTGPAVGPAQTVVAREMAYVPIDVKGVVGRPVTIQFKNEGLLEHDFNVMGIRASGVKAVDVGVSSAHGSAHGSALEAVHVAAGPGKTGTLTFTPLVAGEFPVACSVPGHKEAGMVGTLTVTSE